MTIVDPTLFAGRYRLEFELGSGAFGTVSKATQVVCDCPLRPVAIKILRAALTDSNTIHDSLKEGLLLQSLVADLTDWEIRQHFVTVYDIGISDEPSPRAYVAMELVTGGNLNRRLQEVRKFTLSGALHYVRQIVRAMAQMHEQGYVHCDLKPENILVFRGRDRDLIKIGDLGLSGRYTGPFSQRLQGGTIAYLSKESLSGVDNSPASDVYSIGLIAYELLTGANPFSRVGESLDPDAPDHQSELSAMHLKARENPLKLTPAEFPELRLSPDAEMHSRFLSVINRMLAVRRSDRYRCAGDVLADLELILAGSAPQLTVAGPAADNSSPAHQDELSHRQREFDRLLRDEKWSQADSEAQAMVSAMPHRAAGYLAKSRVSAAQARLMKTRQKVANTFWEQAISHLHVGLSKCVAPEATESLSDAIRKVKQERDAHAS